MARDSTCERSFCCRGECINYSSFRMLKNGRFDVPYDCSVELSALGNQFLTDIFEAYDKVSLSKVTWNTP